METYIIIHLPSNDMLGVREMDMQYYTFLYLPLFTYPLHLIVAVT